MSYHGSFSGHYRCEWLYNKGIWPLDTTIWHFRTDRNNPLTFTGPDGRRWRTGIEYDTDKGSVFWPACGTFRRERWERPYLFHDDGYASGGLWQVDAEAEIEPGAFELVEGMDTFVVMTRAELDLLCCYHAIRAEGALYPEAAAIYSALRIGGWKAWNRYRQAESVTT